MKLTCMQHLQLQKHEDLTPQKEHLYTAPSCEYHTSVATFGMGLLQSIYFQCMSATERRPFVAQLDDENLWHRNFLVQKYMLNIKAHLT